MGFLKKILMTAALMTGAVSVFAYEPEIRDIEVNAKLCPDGSALITEKWDVTVDNITEWYLVRSNLGAVQIKDFVVFDENGRFENIGNWNIDASLSEKRGKCGLHPANGGYELCWGVGSMGPHQYTVMYMLTDAVDILDDAACFHFQLVSPGLSQTPKHVKATVEVRDVQLDSTNVRFWGFGYDGTTYLEDGAVCFESDGSYRRNSSVITLLKLDKDIFTGGNRRAGTFDDVLDVAMEGADFGEYEKSKTSFGEVLLGFLMMALALFFFIFLPVFYGVAGRPGPLKKRKMLGGVKEKDVQWWRELPYDGSLVNTNYALKKYEGSSKKNNIAAAMMLRMVYKNVLTVRKDASGKIEFVINPDADLSYMESMEKSFYDYVVSSSGEDRVLQEKEFSNWGRRHAEELYKWSQSLDTNGKAGLKVADISGYAEKFNDYGKKRLREAVGFKKFLQDFTLVSERESVEANLWQEYLVFAALFGIADKVAKEMKDINPDAFARMMPATDMGDIIIITNNYGRTFNNNVLRGAPVNTSSRPTTGSWGGFGGGSSFGGGGGFHGGGFGGGGR